MEAVSETMQITAGILIAGSIMKKIESLKLCFKDHPVVSIDYEVTKNSLLSRDIFVKLTFANGGDIDSGIMTLYDYIRS